jgi:CRP/FNR family transcriptional regulator, cyclic AMP receptor protein
MWHVLPHFHKTIDATDKGDDMKTVSFKSGDTIIAEGDEGRSAFLIVDGAVEVTIGIGSDAKTVGTFKAGEVFGEMSLIEPGKRTATVRATADTECVETSYEEFVAKIHENPDAAIEFMKPLVRRLRHMNDLMATMDPKKRGLRAFFDQWRDEKEPSHGWADKDEQRRFEEMMEWRMI